MWFLGVIWWLSWYHYCYFIICFFRFVVDYNEESTSLHWKWRKWRRNNKFLRVSITNSKPCFHRFPWLWCLTCIQECKNDHRNLSNICVVGFESKSNIEEDSESATKLRAKLQEVEQQLDESQIERDRLNKENVRIENSLRDAGKMEQCGEKIELSIINLYWHCILL